VLLQHALGSDILFQMIPLTRKFQQRTIRPTAQDTESKSWFFSVSDNRNGIDQTLRLISVGPFPWYGNETGCQLNKSSNGELGYTLEGRDKYKESTESKSWFFSVSDNRNGIDQTLRLISVCLVFFADI
jgi:hypothetical protein